MSTLRAGRRPRVDTAERVRTWMRAFDRQAAGGAPMVPARQEVARLPVGAAAIGQVIEFEIPGATKSNNEIKRMHFRVYAQYQRRLHYEVRCAPGATKPPAPFQWARVTIWRFAPRPLDLDNLYGGCKPLIDCLTHPVEQKPRAGKAGLPGPVRNALGHSFILDDKPTVCDLHVFGEQAPRGSERTVVRIEELLRVAPAMAAA